MKDGSDAPVAAPEPKMLAFLRAAIPFAATLILGSVLTGVAGLFVYANAAEPKSRDIEFAIVSVLGIGASFVAAWFAARRAIEADQTSGTGLAMSLLKKYRRGVTQNSADAQAGQYSIGEHYLRELLGRVVEKGTGHELFNDHVEG